MQLTEKQKDLLIGTLLGDGNLSTTTGQTWRYRALHRLQDLAYLEHKFDLLREFTSTGIIHSEIKDERTQKTYKRCYFNTVHTDTFRFYGQHFYQKQGDRWMKRIPKDIGKFLTPRALAYWYMDDGALKWKGHSNAVRLCTDSFQRFEVERLGEVLKTKFGLQISYQKKGNATRISILEESYEALRTLILGDLHPSMYYKFPDGNRGTLVAPKL